MRVNRVLVSLLCMQAFERSERSPRGSAHRQDSDRLPSIELVAESVDSSQNPGQW